MIEDTAAFYKLDNGELLAAPNFVYAPTYTILRDDPNLVLPIDGWDWYNSIDAARAALGIKAID
jgi:hypothetical protein